MPFTFGGRTINCVGCGRGALTRVGADAHERRCALAQDFLAKTDKSAAFQLLESFLAQLRAATRDQVAHARMSEGEAGSVAAAEAAAWETLWDAESQRYQQELHDLAAARQAP